MEWLPIHYRDFYDVPRTFALRWKENWLFFDCALDQSADEYGENYAVYELDVPPPKGGPWPRLGNNGQAPLATVAVDNVVFDASRRRAIRSELLSAIGIDG